MKRCVLLSCVMGLLAVGPARANDDAVDGPARAALVRFAAANVLWLWPAGTTIEGCFTNGSPDERQMVVEAGEDWMRSANIRFDFGTAPAYRDCPLAAPFPATRVVFGSGSISHATLGTFALVRPSEKPNVFIATSTSSKRLVPAERLRPTIRHELGHVLGLKHEHQHPESACFHMVAWSELCAKRAPELRLPRYIVNNWLPMIGRVNPDYVAGRPYDPLSIMHYKVPDKAFTGPATTCTGERNTALSAGDRSKIALFYPGSLAAQHEMIVAQAPLIAQAILQSGDLDQVAAQRVAREGERTVRRAHPGLTEFRIDLSDGLLPLRPGGPDRGSVALSSFGAGKVEAAVAACVKAEAPSVPGASPTPPLRIKRDDR